MNSQSGKTGSGSSGGVRGQITDLAQTAKTQAASALQPIAKNAKSMAEEQKQRGASRIDSIARAVHDAADEIGDEVPQAASYVHSAAGKLEKASSLLRDNSVEELMQMATEFAQERPIVFVSGAVATGFLLARLLRSSTTAQFNEESEIE
jgi:ABC-type transporter Mla subunit MlaD